MKDKGEKMTYGYMINSDLWFEDEEIANNFLIQLGEIGENPFYKNSVISKDLMTSDPKPLYWLDIHDAYVRLQDYDIWIPKFAELKIRGTLTLTNDFGEIFKIVFRENGFEILKGETVYHKIKLSEM
ncbi:MAG: hypothetical protein Q8N08_05675 [Methanobacteriaceae archaeon]|nr:hypothetical protein [Methanobacteriaceae archaeon]